MARFLQQWYADIIINTGLGLLIAFFAYSFAGGSFFVHFVVACGYGYGCGLIANVIVDRWPHIPISKRYLFAILGGLVLGSINAWVWQVGKTTFIGVPDFLPTLAVAMFFSFFACHFFWSRERALITQTELSKSKAKESEQEKLLAVSQLQLLQSQIEPHFLFNTLATLQVLIEHDPQRANRLLEKLTDMLRASLKKTRQEQVSLEDELHLLEAYLGIQMIRLGERLSYRIDCGDCVNLQQSLPPHLLQPLVENAVTHGIERASVGGMLTITLKQTLDTLMVEIADNGQGFDYHNPGHGVSVGNIRQRLKSLYGLQAKLDIFENPTGGVTSRIVIPCVQ
ncbi:hypothetical protein VST7929_03176 [Vibrio stylophorae]|uniref:Signal transduction histidine kinase internal region domain-containing protein n=1 Tax=Vibrio stylophorae TaxID=659351 RepID=A0ABN8E0N7_9VIBR|nr:histidine kinase [Vibrio stylophorae]CAH0535682.1 hypothetical protein VST7929_03176 [Vibrio stylophorae]